MKKVLCVLLAICLLLIVALPVTANPSNDSDFSFNINEYEMIKKFQSKSDQELTDLGIDRDAINEIRNIDYTEELYERSLLYVQKLKRMGYTDEQIEILKEFSGTEDEIRALAAGLTLDGTGSFSKVGNETRFRVNYEWSWSSLPIMKMNDIIGVGWFSGWNGDYNYSFHKVNYQGLDDSESYSDTDDFDPVGAANAENVFPVVKYRYVGPQVRTDFAYSGEGRFGVYNIDDINTITIYMAYGHSTILPNPSIAYPLGVGFSFSTSVVVPDDGDKSFQYPR